MQDMSCANTKMKDIFRNTHNIGNPTKEESFVLPSRQIKNLRATNPIHQNQLPHNPKAFTFDGLSNICSCSGAKKARYNAKGNL